MGTEKLSKKFNSEGELRHAQLTSFHATQLKFGFREIEAKKKRFKDLFAEAPAKLEKYLQENPVLVVLGPPDLKAWPFPHVVDVAQQIKAQDKDNGKIPDAKADGAAGIYVIDRHHESLALLLAGFKTAPIKIAEDFSDLTPEQFWQKMQDRNLLFYNADNGEPGSFNDAYRSLAWSVRKAGGFNKVDVPYVEFRWADFFRARIEKKLLAKDYEAAVQKALKLARSDPAKDLPGYIAPVAQRASVKAGGKNLKKKL